MGVVARAVMRFLGARQIEGSVDEGDVRESLGKIADQPLASDVVLLRQQAHIVAQASRRWKSARASSRRPMAFSALTIQKLQARKTPSPGGRPSSTLAVS